MLASVNSFVAVMRRVVVELLQPCKVPFLLMQRLLGVTRARKLLEMFLPVKRGGLWREEVGNLRVGLVFGVDGETRVVLEAPLLGNRAGVVQRVLALVTAALSPQRVQVRNRPNLLLRRDQLQLL